MDSATAIVISGIQSTYGALLIGVFFAIFLQGVLTLQAWNYHNDFPEDPVKNKLVVSAVLVFDTVHLVIICQIAYHFLVTAWGIPQALDISTWELQLHILFVGLSCFTCQIFFLQRIWVFSQRNRWVTGFAFILCLVTLAWSIFIPINLFSIHEKPSQWGTLKANAPVLFAFGAASDLFMAGLLCYYLRLDRSKFKGTRSFIRQIVQYTVITGLLTSSVEVCGLILFLVKPLGLYYIAVHICLGRLYTNSLLAILNTRKNMQKSVRISEGIQLPNTGMNNQDSSEATGTKKATASAIVYTIEHVTHRDKGIEMSSIVEKGQSLV